MACATQVVIAVLETPKVTRMDSSIWMDGQAKTVGMLQEEIRAELALPYATNETSS